MAQPLYSTMDHDKALNVVLNNLKHKAELNAAVVSQVNYTEIRKGFQQKQHLHNTGILFNNEVAPHQGIGGTVGKGLFQSVGKPALPLHLCGRLVQS